MTTYTLETSQAGKLTFSDKLSERDLFEIVVNNEVHNSKELYSLAIIALESIGSFIKIQDGYVSGTFLKITRIK
jgi:hypothetical protein